MEEKTVTKRKREKFVPNSNYKDKYAHIIGQEAALEGARKTETNQSYGFGKWHKLLCKCCIDNS